MLQSVESVEILDHIFRFGKKYSIGDIVIISKEIFEYQFGLIKVIVCENEKCVFVIEKNFWQLASILTYMHTMLIQRKVTLESALNHLNY